MTELSPVGTFAGMKGTSEPLTTEQRAALQAKQGWGTPLVEMRIVGEDGQALPWDGRAFGELQVRGPTVVHRYFRHEGNHGVDADGWFSTGDVATIDPKGYMQITDRSKDVIKSGGEWISSIEIENAAVSHPKVLEAAVVAIPHPKWTERPLLVVVPQPGNAPSREELLGFLQGKVAKWWVPDDVAFVAELPHTATGKISKLTLRQRFANHTPSQARL